MLKKRIIPTLLYNNISLVKGRNFNNWRSVGSPITAMKIYNLRDVDEIYFAFTQNENLNFNLDFISDLSDECSVPLTIGGGIKSLSDVDEILKSGADKIALNTIALKNPEFIKKVIDKYGSQQVVISIDYKKSKDDYYCYSNSGTKNTGINLFNWIDKVQNYKAGEIILCSIDHDGMMNGYDIQTFKKIINSVDIPLVISGGAGSKKNILDAFENGASAASISSLFHFTEITPKEIKEFLNNHSIPIRI